MDGTVRDGPVAGAVARARVVGAAVGARGVSVVVDTVFVRSMLVPAVMGVLNSWNWWPLELPAVSIREARLDFEE